MCLQACQDKRRKLEILVNMRSKRDKRGMIALAIEYRTRVILRPIDTWVSMEKLGWVG